MRGRCLQIYRECIDNKYSEQVCVILRMFINSTAYIARRRVPIDCDLGSTDCAGGGGGQRGELTSAAAKPRKARTRSACGMLPCN